MDPGRKGGCLKSTCEGRLEQFEVRVGRRGEVCRECRGVCGSSKEEGRREDDEEGDD